MKPDAGLQFHDKVVILAGNNLAFLRRFPFGICLGTHKEESGMEQNVRGSLALRARERFLEELREVNTITARFGLKLSEQGMLFTVYHTV